MAMVIYGGSYSFDGTDDEDDDDNDDVEHDVKDVLIVDSRRRLEQHNIMSSTTGATARRNKNFKNGECGPHGRSRCNCSHEWWWRRSEQVL